MSWECHQCPNIPVSSDPLPTHFCIWRNPLPYSNPFPIVHLSPGPWHVADRVNQSFHHFISERQKCKAPSYVCEAAPSLLSHAPASKGQVKVPRDDLFALSASCLLIEIRSLDSLTLLFYLKRVLAPQSLTKPLSTSLSLRRHVNQRVNLPTAQSFFAMICRAFNKVEVCRHFDFSPQVVVCVVGEPRNILDTYRPQEGSAFAPAGLVVVYS